jgi:copper resistance protein D
MADILSVVLRALSFVLQLQAAGAVFFAAAFGPALTISLSSVRSLARIAAIAAFFVAGAHYLLEAARMVGDLSGVFDGDLQAVAWKSSTGGAFSVRELGLLLIVAGMQTTSVRLTAERFFKSPTAMSPGFWMKRLSSRGFTIAGVGGAVLVAASFTLTGHTSTSGWRWLLAPLLLAHLLIVAFWFGSLGPLYLVTLREPRERAARAVTLFSSAAFWLVPLILVAGAAIAVLLFPSVAALWQPYGLLVIAKGCLFAVLLGLAAFNKWRFGPALGNGDLSAGRVFRRMVIAEYVLIGVVLSVTAVMTTFFSPE